MLLLLHSLTRKQRMMPRQARKLSRTGVYHVMLRGINRQDIFEDDEDYRQMTGCLRSLTERYDEMITRTVPMILKHYNYLNRHDDFPVLHTRLYIVLQPDSVCTAEIGLSGYFGVCNRCFQRPSNRQEAAPIFLA